jgi:hypothetical protein
LPPEGYYWYWAPRASTVDYSYYANEWNGYPGSVPTAATGIGLPRHRDLEGFTGYRTSPGYRDLEWGTPVSYFTLRYPDVVEITDPGEGAIGVRRFSQEFVGGGVDSRQFVFFHNQLFEVYVLYGFVDGQTARLMEEKLTGMYGNVFKTASREATSPSARFRMVDNYISYNPYLQVVFTIADVYNIRSHRLGTIMTCLYVNLPTKARVESLRQNMLLNRLPL